MVGYNPDAPTALGLQWWPTRYGSLRVDEGAAWVQRLPSTTSEEIVGVKTSATYNPFANPSRELWTLFEVYEEGTESSPSAQMIDLFPNGDIEIGQWETLSGSTNNLWEQLQTPIVWPNSTVQATGIRKTASGDPASYVCSIDTSSFAPSGALSDARICRVELGVVAAVTDVSGNIPNPPTRIVRLELRNNGELFNPVQPGGIGGFLAHGFGEAFVFPFGEINPLTELPWTTSDILEFDGGDWELRFRGPSASSTGAPTVFSLCLRVWTVPQENRLAVGMWRRPTGSLGSSFLIEPETDEFVSWPDQNPVWEKPSSGNHLWVWRQARSNYHHSGSGLSKDVQYLRSNQDFGSAGGLSAPPSNLRGDQLTFDVYGVTSQSFDDTAYFSISAISPQVAGGASVDGQPYRVFGLATSILDESSVVDLISSIPIGQRLTSPVNANYAGYHALIAPPSTGTSTLTISVHEWLSGDQVGGAATWTAGEVRAETAIGSGTILSSLRVIDGFFDDFVPLEENEEYEIRLSVSGDTWQVILPSASIGPEGSFQGASGAVIGGVNDPERDLTITLTIAPAEPENVELQIVTDCINTFACVDRVQHAQLRWEPGEPNLGEGFDHYDIDRRILEGDCEPEDVDGDCPWQRIARIAEEDTLEFIDRSTPRGRRVQYRIRSVGGGDAQSPWVISGVITPEPTGAEIIFTSNHRPDLEVVYEHTPTTEYTFLDHESDQIIPVFGADYQVSFFEPEDRGLEETYDIYANFADLPLDAYGNVIGGRETFEPLRQISRAVDIPYVIVLDRHGNVTYAHLRLFNGVEEQPLNRYSLRVEVTPVTDIPVVVEM